MKAGFSIGEALAAPFRLARRRPLSMLVWGLLMVAPALASGGLSLSLLGSLSFADLDKADGGAAFETVVPQLMQFQALSGLLFLLQMLLMVMVTTAVIRAVLNMGRPERFFFLRLGMDELRVTVVLLALLIGLYVGLLILMALGVSAGFALWSIGEPGNVLAAVGIGVVCVVVVWIAMLRVSLMAPASVLYRDFAFAQGWALARGQVLRLFGLALLMVLIGLATYLVVAAIIVGGLIAAGLMQGWPDPAMLARDGQWFTRAPDWRLVAPWALAATVPVSFLYGFWAALGTAPLASAAQQLAGGQSQASPPGPHDGRDATPPDTLGLYDDTESLGAIR